MGAFGWIEVKEVVSGEPERVESPVPLEPVWLWSTKWAWVVHLAQPWDLAVALPAHAAERGVDGGGWPRDSHE